MANTFTKIATVTVGSGGASSMEFTSIPATYVSLIIKLSARTDRSGFTYDNIVINPNSSTSNLSGIYILSYGSGVLSATDTGGIGAAGANGASATSSTFSNVEIYIPNYTSSSYKSFSVDAVMENNATDGRQGFTSQLWSSTTAISSLKIAPSSGPNFVQYSSATLYGISNS